MATTNFNIRLDDGLKAKAFPVFEQYGLTAAQAIKLFLNQVAETHSIPLSFDYAKPINYEQNPISMQAIEDARAGKVMHHDSIEDMLEAIKGEP